MAFDLSRRGFFAGLGASLVAAPAIVRAASLMPVKVVVRPHPCKMWASYLHEYNLMVENAILYGNSEWSPTQFTGLVPLSSESEPVLTSIPAATWREFNAGASRAA